MKTKFFLIAIVAMLCSFIDMRADRVMPTKPTPATLESGKTYYLYNVGTERLLSTYASSSNYAGLDAIGRKVEITQQDNGEYTIKFVDNDYYFSAYYNTGCRVNEYKNITNYCYWQISSTEDGYKINISPVNTSYYKEGIYVGATNATNQVVPNLTEGNIIWQLYENNEDIERQMFYNSKIALYRALEEAEDAGYSVEKEEAIYNNPESTAEELSSTAASLNNNIAMSKGYTAPSWNEYPILFQASEGTYGQSYGDTWSLPDNHYTTGSYFCRSLSNSTSTLTATITVDKLSTFIYDLDGTDSNCNLTVCVDGVQKRYLYNYKLSADSKSNAGRYNRFFEVLEPGTHTISWKFVATTTYRNVYVLNIGCMATSNEISVNLLEPGSLGTEVLYSGLNHIKNVRKLKIKGPMNNDDWAQIQMMDSLFELDLGEAEVSSIPAKQFDGNVSAAACQFLHKVITPKSLQSIGDYAFRYTHIEDMIFPQGCKLTTIGQESLSITNLREIILPDSVQSIGKYAMYRNYQLEKVSLGKVLTSVPEYCFRYDHSITEMILPNTIKTVNEGAFHECNAMQLDSLPSNLKTIAYRGFYGCNKIKINKWPKALTTIGEYACAGWHRMDSIVIPSYVTSIGSYAFQNCGNLKYAELPSGFYTIPDALFQGCPLQTLTLKSASVAEYYSGNYPVTNYGSVKLRVPNYLVNYYKQDAYWYNFKEIEGFGTEEVDSWDIYRPCVLDSHNRYAGTPDVKVYENASLKISGALPMDINNFIVDHGGSSSGLLQSNCESIAIKGDCSIHYYTTASKWHFISLPFDIAVADIVKTGSNVQYAIRYYDGANRAEKGASGSWKNYTSDDIIPAGTGFIFQTNVNTWTEFHALDNESKQNIVSYEEFVKLLSAHDSENAADKGWNLVGNPYQTYYNNHYLNFTAPITVWNISNSTYSAKSLIDDDYAIRPNEAFFVQCPNEANSLSFPVGGRQLTSVITDQNVQAKPRSVSVNNRQLIDLTLSAYEHADNTRIVFNEDALCSYELSCDAGKFFSEDTSIPQLFTVGPDGTEYAINERPLDNGEVRLAFQAPLSGTYTLSVSHCDAEHVYLTDLAQGITTDITGQAYTFESEAGLHTARFSLSVVPGATDIASVSARSSKVCTTEEGIKLSGLTGDAHVYSTDGRMIATASLSGEETTVRVPQGIYIVRTANQAYKVVVK